MSRRRNSAKTILDLITDILYILITLCIYLVKFLINIIAFFGRMIIFYRTKYKIKSGNGFIKTYFDKGYWGEYQLYRKLIKVFGEDKLLTNIYLPSKNVDNTEIDVLGVHDGIIYCYEVKNYGGNIYGKQGDKTWTQVLRFKTKNKFYNPVRQNYAHVKALEEFLEIEEKDIVPIVVFSYRANLDNVEIGKANIKKSNCNFSVYDSLKGSLSDDDIISKLSGRTNVDESIKQEHIDQLKQLKL